MTQEALKLKALTLAMEHYLSYDDEMTAEEWKRGTYFKGKEKEKIVPCEDYEHLDIATVVASIDGLASTIAYAFKDCVKEEAVQNMCKKLFSRDTSVQELVDIANDPKTPEIELARYYFDTSLVHSFIAPIIIQRLGVEKLTDLKEKVKKEFR